MIGANEAALSRRFEAHVRANSDAEAIVGEHQRTTFGALFERVDRVMGLLVAEGWTPESVVGIAIEDTELHIAASLAVLCLGGAHVCLPSHETPESNRAVAEKVGVAFVLRSVFRGWMEGLRTIELTDAAISHAPRGFDQARPTEPGAAAIYIKTSGSTGVPKVFGISFERVAAGAMRSAREENERRVMRTATVEFDSTRLYRFFALFGGRATILFPSDMARLGEVCALLDVSQVHIGPYNLGSLVGSSRDISRMPPTSSIMTGGSRVPGAMRAAIADRLTERLWISYATSEVGRISTAEPEEHAAFPEGIGFPQPGVEVEIVDEEGGALPHGETGEIRVRCPNSPSAYVAQNSAQFRDGWFYPNDLVSWPEGGPLVYHGRTDDVMLLNGIKVSGGAIEDALVGQPGVAEAVAFPMRSRVHGEIPAAAVVLAPEAEQRDPAALLRRCRELLGARAPRRIVVLDKIPRTLTGKPLKTALAEL